MFLVFVLNSVNQLIKSVFALITTFASSVRRDSKSDVVISSSQSTRLTMVVIATRHNHSVDIAN